MRRSLPMLAWLTLVWVALWGELSAANLLGGLAVGMLALLLVPPRHSDRTLSFRPVAALRLVVYFMWKLVEASAVVAWEVATPRNRINEAIVAIPLKAESGLLITLVANAVSLTPGTLSLEVVGRPAVLYVHVLHLRDIETVRWQIGQLERLATLALAPRSRDESMPTAHGQQGKDR